MRIFAEGIECKVSVREVCAFLSEYSVYLFGSGATCIRMERNLIRMAERMGMQIALSIMPNHIHLTVFDNSSGESATSISNIGPLPVSYKKIALLSKLSWAFADGRVDFEECKRRFVKITKLQNLNFNRVAVLLSIANASFCRLFGGDVWGMAIVFAVTIIGFATKHFLSRCQLDFRATVVICSFISASLAAVGNIFLPTMTPGVAVGTSVLYLVPGIPFINSFCDMLDRHYICAFGRLMNAVVILACLSLGLCSGMWLMKIGMF